VLVWALCGGKSVGIKASACPFLDQGPEKSIFNFTGAALVLKSSAVTQLIPDNPTTKCLLKEEKEEKEDVESPTARNPSPNLPRYVPCFCVVFIATSVLTSLNFTRLDYNSQSVVLVVS